MPVIIFYSGVVSGVLAAACCINGFFKLIASLDKLIDDRTVNFILSR